MIIKINKGRARIWRDQKIIDLYTNREERAIHETDKKYGRLCTSISMGILNDIRDSEECVSDT